MTPTGRLFDGAVDCVNLPGGTAPFQVLANHAPTVSSLCAGNIDYKVRDIISTIKIKSGFASIACNQVRIVCESME